jgi:hypothetical protein
MTFYEVLLEGGFLHPLYGVVANRPHSGERFEKVGHVWDNYFLGTAVAAAIAELIGESRSAAILKRDLCAFADHCSVEGKPGLYLRYPGQEGSISWDEMYGIASVGTYHAIQIEKYGEKSDWSYNPRAPEKWSWDTWAARHVGFSAYLRSRCGLTVGEANQFLWAGKAIVTSLSGHGSTSGKQLVWLQGREMRRHPICRDGIAISNRRMARLYPGGPRELFGIYYGPSHPIASFAPESWDQ